MRLTDINKPKDRIPATNTSVSSRGGFAERLTGSDTSLHKLLKTRQIHSFHTLQGHLSTSQRINRHLRRLNRSLTIGLAMTVVMVMGCSYWFYQVDYKIPTASLSGISASIGPSVKTHQIFADERVMNRSSEMSRNIFQPVVKLATTDPLESERQNLKFVKTFRIVGVVMDAEPQLIVEDVSNQTTLFVGIQDQLGEATVISIHATHMVYELFGEMRTMDI